LALSENTDVSNTAQLANFVCGLDISLTVHHELTIY